MRRALVQGARAIAGLPVLFVAYQLADFGAFGLAERARELARWIAGMK